MPNTTAMMSENILDRFIQIIGLKCLWCLGDFSSVDLVLLPKKKKKILNLVCSRHDLQVNPLTLIQLSSEPLIQTRYL